MSFLLRPAEAGDLTAIAAIYAEEVLHGRASFEEVPPDVEEMRRRWQGVTERELPYLVAVGQDPWEGEPILGYAYAGPYRPRPAYRHTLEDSVYLHPAARRQGIGTALLAELLDRSAALGYRQMVAIIGDSDNAASIELHRKLGFQRIGVLRSVGFKLGKWVDSVLMQRALGTGDGSPPSRP